MKLFGLTGGIGTGKSAAAEFLARAGVQVVDTDVLARDLVRPGEPALAQIVAAFGRSVLDEQGALNRSALANLVFPDPARRRQLEGILHPAIRTRWLAEVSSWRTKGCALGVVVIPLLFETSAEPLFGSVICTACTAPTQRQRLLARGWSDQQIKNRLDAQWPMEKKIAASNIILWTEGSLEIHHRQLGLVLKRFQPSPPGERK